MDVKTWMPWHHPRAPFHSALLPPTGEICSFGSCQSSELFHLFVPSHWPLSKGGQMARPGQRQGPSPRATVSGQGTDTWPKQINFWGVTREARKESILFLWGVVDLQLSAAMSHRWEGQWALGNRKERGRRSEGTPGRDRREEEDSLQLLTLPSILWATLTFLLDLWNLKILRYMLSKFGLCFCHFKWENS